MKNLVLMTAAVASMLILSLSAFAIKDDSLVLYLSFDEGQGNIAKDGSGKGNNGTLRGGAAWTKDGKIGGAISFNGVDAGVVVQDSDSLDLADKLTLEAWAYSNDVTGGYKGIISKEDWNNAKGYYIGQNAKEIYLGFNKGKKNEIQGGKFDTNKKWYHVAGTFDASLKSNNLKIYINGELALEGGMNEVPIAHATTLDIGWIHDLKDSFFSGMIDEVAIYRRALSPEEIKKDMMQGPIAAVANLDKISTVWGKIKSN